MVQELRQVFGSLDPRLEARVVVVRGAGRAFCAGMDVKDLAEIMGKGAQDGKGSTGLATNGHMLQRSVSDIVIQMRRAPQPLIGAIRGPAAGGRFELTMACRIRLAGQSARFNANKIRIGYSGGDLGSSYFLPRLIGLSRAAGDLSPGRLIAASTADG